MYMIDINRDLERCCIGVTLPAFWRNFSPDSDVSLIFG